MTTTDGPTVSVLKQRIEQVQWIARCDTCPGDALWEASSTGTSREYGSGRVVFHSRVVACSVCGVGDDGEGSQSPAAVVEVGLPVPGWLPDWVQRIGRWAS